MFTCVENITDIQNTTQWLEHQHLEIIKLNNTLNNLNSIVDVYNQYNTDKPLIALLTSNEQFNNRIVNGVGLESLVSSVRDVVMWLIRKIRAMIRSALRMMGINKLSINTPNLKKSYFKDTKFSIETTMSNLRDNYIMPIDISANNYELKSNYYKKINTDLFQRTDLLELEDVKLEAFINDTLKPFYDKSTKKIKPLPVSKKVPFKGSYWDQDGDIVIFFDQDKDILRKQMSTSLEMCKTKLKHFKSRIKELESRTKHGAQSAEEEIAIKNQLVNLSKLVITATAVYNQGTADLNIIRKIIENIDKEYNKIKKG